MATVASVFFVGAMMLVGGSVQVICAFNVKGWRQFAGWLLIGAFTSSPVCSHLPTRFSPRRS
ncbi:hypothetical protein HGG75_04670 [Ochrobactrum pseudogrignonense]|nr:hypothetical protein [Brucella pseudogrignonensis]